MMDKKLVQTEKEAQKLQSRVRRLEQQLAEARAALDTLTPGTNADDRIQNDGPLSRVLFEAPYPVMIRRGDGRVVMVNQAWTKLTGYSLEEIPTIDDWIQKAYREGVSQQASFLRTDGFSQAGMQHWGEFAVQTRFGTHLTWDFSTTPLGFDAKGRELSMVMVVDVTQRRQAEEARVESERQHQETARLLELDRARLSTILENLPVGVWLTDETGRIIAKNKQADQIWAGDAPLLERVEDYQQYQSWDAQSGKLLESQEYPVAKVLHTGQRVEPVELNIRRFDGSHGTVLVSAVPIQDTRGTLTGVVGINVDLTTRKQAEQALRDSEDRFSKAFRKAPFAMNITRWLDGTILDVNEAWLSLLGWTRQEVLGKTTADFPFYARPRERHGVRHRIMNDESLSDMELELVRKDGSRRIVTVATTIVEMQGERCILGVLHDITDRKQAENALRESEQLYHGLFETMQEGLVAAEIITDDQFRPLDYRYLDVNPATERQFGIPRENFIGRTYTEVLPDADREWVEILGRVALTGEPAHVERYSATTGRWFEAHAYSPRAGQFINIQTDITERKQAEDALRRSEAQYRSLVETAFEGIWTVDTDGRTVFVNQRMAEMLKYDSPVELMNRSAFDFIPPEDRIERKKQFAARVENNRSERYEVRLRCRDGSVIWVSASSSSVLDEDGNVTGRMALFIDITERRQAEESLRESEERFRSLADSMPQLVWTALPDGTVDYYNRRYQEYQEIKQVHERTWEWSPVLHPDDVQITVDAWQHAVSTGEMYQIEHRVRMANGDYRWHLSRGIPVTDPQGRLLRWFGTATDIHEQKLAEEQLQTYAQKLERSNRELEQFAFMASHDLQEPLRKIQMFGGLLLDRSKSLAENEREYVERMRSAAGRMREMVNGLLQLSRVNTQSQPFSEADLSHVTDEALSDLAEQVRRSGGHVHVDALPSVYGDPLQIRQLMQNLIGNALKYHKPGVAPEVKVYARQLADRVQIFVEDQGIGFEQEYAERIFQPFQRLVGRSEYEGSGMGLAICRKIVERHGGEITAQSKPGEGTTFIVSLPTQRAHNPEKDA